MSLVEVLFAPRRIGCVAAPSTWFQERFGMVVHAVGDGLKIVCLLQLLDSMHQ